MSYKITKYPDKSAYAEVGDAPETSYTLKVNSYEDLWHLNQFVEALNNKGVRPIITIPNLIDAQADRRFKDDQSSGLKLVCKFLSSMDASFKIFHPHNPEVVEALMDNVEIIDNTFFIDRVIENIVDHDFKFEYVEHDLILMSSDAGGFKPLMKLVDKIGWEGETFSASKARSWDSYDKKSKFIQQIDREDFEGKDILIIDDISVRGGTFKGLSKLLRERNVGKLYLAVSHMTVQDLGDDPVTNYFDRVFTTNSKFDRYYGKYAEGSDRTTQPKNLEILKLF